MSDVLRKGLIQGAIAFVVSKFVLPFILPFVLPFVLPLLVGALAYFEGENAFHIVLGILASFMFVTGGLLFADQWLERRNVTNKIALGACRNALEIDANGAITGLAFGFTLTNHAAFPIEFELVDMQTGFNGWFPPRKPYAVTSFPIPAHGRGWFDDHVIKIVPPLPAAAAEGFMNFEVRFGRKGRVKHSLKKAFKVWAQFDRNGQFQGATWLEEKT